jgi:hypothetical protein
LQPFFAMPRVVSAGRPELRELNRRAFASDPTLPKISLSGDVTFDPDVEAYYRSVGVKIREGIF